NWGRNTKYEGRDGARRRPAEARTKDSLSPFGGEGQGEGAINHPIKLFYGDIDDVGKMDLLYSTYDTEMKALVPERMLDFLNKSIRFIAERFSSHTAFAKATLQEILADRMPRLQSLEAAWLESTLFLNRGDH